jgi:hypothetical protein
VPPFAPASAVWRIGIRIGFVLAFIAAYAIIFFFETAPATLHDRANSQIPGAPQGLLVLEAAFLLLPFLAAFVLLFQTRHQALMATGSGIAVGFFGLFLLVSPFALLTAFMLLGLSANQMSGGADPGVSRAMLALLALIAISIWIVVCAAVSPGPTRTEGTDAMGEGLEQLAAQAPAGRPATADEIAEAIVFLATDRSSFIYGAKLAVDGGRTAI